MMKIGILTFHRALNYGAVLQCYALQETLSQMGHDVEVINYRPEYIEEYRYPFVWKTIKNAGLKIILKRLLLYPLYYRNIKKAVRAFDSFANKNINISREDFVLDSVCNNYNAIIFGSDQIWSPQICRGFDSVYWGQIPKGETKFIAYAPSYGGHNKITDKEKKEIAEKLTVFDSLSTREEQLKKFLTPLYTNKIYVVLDPTLLAGKDVFAKIAIKPQDDKYVLLFTVEETPGARSFANRIAKERGCKVVRLSAIPNIREKEAEVRSAVTPGEFCGYFQNAEFIVAVSFHGTAFSVIFNKDFYTLHSAKEDRARNLLSNIGLKSRLVTPEDVKEITTVEYEKANMNLHELRRESINFLAEALLEIKRNL